MDKNELKKLQECNTIHSTLDDLFKCDSCNLLFEQNNTTNKTLAILSIKRLKNSIYGNPKYELKTLQGVYKTSENASIAYRFEFTKLQRGDLINVELSKRGTIIDAQKIKLA